MRFIAFLLLCLSLALLRPAVPFAEKPADAPGDPSMPSGGGRNVDELLEGFDETPVAMKTRWTAL